MLRTTDERDERQRALKNRNEETWDSGYLTIQDCAREMKISRATAHRIFRFEPGVEAFRAPGSHRPMIRVPRVVFDRVQRRHANPWKES